MISFPLAELNSFPLMPHTSIKVFLFIARLYMLLALKFFRVNENGQTLARI